MKKNIIMMLLALMLCAMVICTDNTTAYAEEQEEDVDMSFLLTEDALIGHMEYSTYGVYLWDGFSVINDAGNGKIGAGGMTTAARACNVTINSIVERKTSSGTWARVTSWVAEKEYDSSVAISKYLTVGKGSYYRVRSIHSASSDVSSSCTSALLID